jgi:hypothetical protein
MEVAEYYVTIMGLSVPTFEETNNVGDIEDARAIDEIKKAIGALIVERSWETADVSVHPA